MLVLIYYFAFLHWELQSLSLPVLHIYLFLSDLYIFLHPILYFTLYCVFSKVP